LFCRLTLNSPSAKKWPTVYTDEIRPGECKVAVAGDQKIAIANINGSFYAIANECPHKGGPLGDGCLKGELLKCPWHDWHFNVITGENDQSENVKLKTYRLAIEDERIWVLI